MLLLSRSIFPWEGLDEYRTELPSIAQLRRPEKRSGASSPAARSRFLPRRKLGLRPKNIHQRRPQIAKMCCHSMKPPETIQGPVQGLKKPKSRRISSSAPFARLPLECCLTQPGKNPQSATNSHFWPHGKSNQYLYVRIIRLPWLQ